jgi:hypothetical protein
MNRQVVRVNGTFVLAIFLALLVSATVMTTAARMAMASGEQHAGSAHYMRAVPAGPLAQHPCRRACVKSKSEGKKAAPMCLQWQSVC